MKIMNVFRIIVALAVIIAVPSYAAENKVGLEIASQDAVDKVAEVRKAFEAVILEEAQKTVNAIVKRNEALEALILKAKDAATHANLEALLIEQDAIIEDIKQNLPAKARAVGVMIDETEREAGYFSQFFTSVKNKLIAGHSSTPLEKYLASAIIVKLHHLKKTIKSPLYIQMLNDEIRNQKIITGDAWSRERQALWAGVTTLVMLGTLMYLSAPVEAPVVKAPDTTKTGFFSSLKQKFGKNVQPAPAPIQTPTLPQAPVIQPQEKLSWKNRLRVSVGLTTPEQIQRDKILSEAHQIGRVKVARENKWLAAEETARQKALQKNILLDAQEMGRLRAAEERVLLESEDAAIDALERKQNLENLAQSRKKQSIIAEKPVTPAIKPVTPAIKPVTPAIKQ